MKALSSRGRLLAALGHQEPDRVPVMFWGTIAPLRHLWKTPFERVKVLRELGVDDQLYIGCPWPYHPDVRVERSRDDSRPGYPLLTKEFHTPAGVLCMTVRKTPDYPWDDPPIMADHNWSRATEFLVKGPEDLGALRYILYEAPAEDVDDFRDRARQVKEFCEAEQVLLAGSVPSPSNLAMNLLGATNMMMHSVDNRPFLRELLGVILSWCKSRLEIVLSLGVDTLQFSGIYESTAFWSPHDYDDLFAPGVRQIADLAHAAGARFHYFSDARIMGRVERFRDLGADALSYLNPAPMGDADLGEIKRRVGDRVCLWGGISAPITIEQGTREDVRRAVSDAIQAAAPGGGFILATADAILRESAYDNMMAMIETCHRLGRYPIRA